MENYVYDKKRKIRRRTLEIKIGRLKASIPELLVFSDFFSQHAHPPSVFCTWFGVSFKITSCTEYTKKQIKENKQKKKPASFKNNEFLRKRQNHAKKH